MYCETSALEPVLGSQDGWWAREWGAWKTVGQETVCDVLSGLCQMSMSEEMLEVLVQRWTLG